MKLIIAEKPSLGRSIASALGVTERREGYMEGNDFLVSWCFGHLYELADLENYWDPSHKKGDKVSWEDSMSRLPYFPEDWRFRYEPRQGCTDQISILAELINRPDVDVIYAAGDADREGEVIVRLVLEANMKTHKTVLRLWLPAVTDEVIRQAVADARPDSEYDAIYYAGKTRAAVDWLIGIELTRFSSVKAGRFLRIGRCICPIVSKIVEREQAIRDFVPEDYYAVVGEVVKDGKKLELVCRQRFGKDKIGEAESYADHLNKEGTNVIGVEKKEVEVKPPLLFSMSALQSFVCKKNKTLSPSDVLAAAQLLYEKGYVTYPRTNSQFLSSSEQQKVDEIIAVFGRDGISGLVNKPTSRRTYDDAKVESHSAIIPTGKMPVGLTGTEALVYDCVKNRFLAVFYELPCIAERTSYTIQCGEETFSLKGDVLIEKGWQNFEDPGKKDADLPLLAEGERIDPGFQPSKKQTSPPKRFTVETLTNWMLAPMRSSGEETHEGYSDREWKDILSEATICTEATRADTIDRCIKSKYIALEKGVFSATDYGFSLVEAMGKLGIDLSVEKTVELSRCLHEISVGKMEEQTVLDETKRMLTSVIRMDVEDLAGNAGTGKEKEQIGRCPICTKPVYENKKAFYCSDKTCGFTIWKESKYLDAIGTKMTKTRAKALLKDGKFLAKGLKSKKTGKEYDAYICLDGLDENRRVQWRMEFPTDR